MKKSLLVLASILLLASCAKESKQVENGEQFSVSVVAGIEEQSTKAGSDIDGFAKKVDHWIMEVRDADGNLYTREERSDVAAGTKSQTFTATLVKGNSYTFQFWADTKGAYVTDDLTAISAADTVANKDSRDAFSVNKAYDSSMGKSISATLMRPFAQLNIQTIDLETLWETTKGATSRTEYDRFEPKNLKAKLTIPTTFNVKTQEAGGSAEVTLGAASVYSAYQSDSTTLKEHNNFYNHVNPATLFMDYIFASAKEADVHNIDFSFTTNSKSVALKFTNIPLQRNFRTNIKGSLMTDSTEWTVIIDPTWYGEYGIDY